MIVCDEPASLQLVLLLFIIDSAGADFMMSALPEFFGW
jgi:hypothetical protein